VIGTSAASCLGEHPFDHCVTLSLEPLIADHVCPDGRVDGLAHPLRYPVGFIQVAQHLGVLVRLVRRVAMSRLSVKLCQEPPAWRKVSRHSCAPEPRTSSPAGNSVTRIFAVRSPATSRGARPVATHGASHFSWASGSRAMWWFDSPWAVHHVTGLDQTPDAATAMATPGGEERASGQCCNRRCTEAPCQFGAWEPSEIRLRNERLR
jgi:hypothetical protein